MEADYICTTGVESRDAEIGERMKKVWTDLWSVSTPASYAPMGLEQSEIERIRDMARVDINAF